ncbi:MAG TPA: type I DNA topoisomerase, partial [Dehalococcoidia bacterium]|nr:type I DNA topoisomerase [Dehalococcoidia bacterium]
REKRDVVNKIKEAATKANAIYLATDPDREGEAISWHLVAAAELDSVAGRTLQRVVFHEITPGAIHEAFQHPRDIDRALVDAQQARRILDRLVGYQISPLLWRKVRRGLSAGRVQSAALKMVVDREREILAFNAKEYWTIDTTLATAPAQTAPQFVARLRGFAGKRNFEVGSEAEAFATTAQLQQAAYSVKSVRRRDIHRRPAPPFTTSTLQQEASRRFGYTARRTMALAQQLYEGIELKGSERVGLITYMRTDSTNLADVAVSEIRAYVGQRYGGDFLPSAPRVYKARKGAQEAHEAIRPTSVDRTPDSPELRGLTNDLKRLYTLIWQRAVACQMADAVLDSVSVDVDAVAQAGVYQLRATASALHFPGFRALYEEQRDEPATGEEAEQTLSAPLPEMSEGDALHLRDIKSDQHFTEPPPRYTEATLVKGLEENGIGRPSTYAPIISTIQDRGYVEKDGRALKPTELGFVVTDFMTEQFPNVVDLRFTAGMEEELDEIASGVRMWQPTVRELYNPLSEALESAEQAPKVVQETGELCPECERPLIRRFGRFGPFFACSGFPECRYTRPDGDQEQETTDEVCDLCASAMTVKRGRFGPFLACSKYPECKGTKPLLQKTGVPCPKCGGEIVERQTRQKRRFYGCAKYPECDYTSWQRPLTQVCPECKGLIVAERGRRARCTNCEWSGPASEAIERPEITPKLTAGAGVT